MHLRKKTQTGFSLALLAAGLFCFDASAIRNKDDDKPGRPAGKAPKPGAKPAASKGAAAASAKKPGAKPAASKGAAAAPAKKPEAKPAASKGAAAAPAKKPEAKPAASKGVAAASAKKTGAKQAASKGAAAASAKKPEAKPAEPKKPAKAEQAPAPERSVRFTVKQSRDFFDRVKTHPRLAGHSDKMTFYSECILGSFLEGAPSLTSFYYNYDTSTLIFGDMRAKLEGHLKEICEQIIADLGVAPTATAPNARLHGATPKAPAAAGKSRNPKVDRVNLSAADVSAILTKVSEVSKHPKPKVHDTLTYFENLLQVSAHNDKATYYYTFGTGVFGDEMVKAVLPDEFRPAIERIIRSHLDLKKA